MGCAVEAYIVMAMAYVAYYLRTKTHVTGALRVSAILDLHDQNC